MGVSTGVVITVWNLGSLRGITWAGAIACVHADPGVRRISFSDTFRRVGDGGANMDDRVGVGDGNIGGGKGDQDNGYRSA